MSYFNVTGTYPPLVQGAVGPSGSVTLTPIGEVADGTSIAADQNTVIQVVAGVVTPTEMLYVAGIIYRVHVSLSGANDQSYAFTPTGADVNLATIARQPVQAGVVGIAGPAGPAGVVSPTLVGPFFKVGPISYVFVPANGDTGVLIADRSATDGDASLLLRTGGAIQFEAGLDAAGNKHLKAVTGAAGSETFTDALIVRNADALVEVVKALGVGTFPATGVELHVAGSSTVARVTGKLENTNVSAGSAGTQFNLAGNGINWAFGTDVGLNGGNNLFFVNANGAYMTGFLVNAAGQVGVLTDSPGSALDVNGAVTVRGDNGLSPVRIRGRKTTPLAPTTGTWTAGDTVMDSAKTWWLCTAGGTPGTWV